MQQQHVDPMHSHYPTHPWPHNLDGTHPMQPPRMMDPYEIDGDEQNDRISERKRYPEPGLATFYQGIKDRAKRLVDLHVHEPRGSSGIGGHLKTCQSWTGQNRPVGRACYGMACKDAPGLARAVQVLFASTPIGTVRPGTHPGATTPCTGVCLTRPPARPAGGSHEGPDHVSRNCCMRV